MQVIVKDNSAKIKRDQAVKANVFLRMVADEVVREATPKTPMSDGYAKGNLRRNVLKQVLGLTGQIIWGENYAEYQERGYTSGPVKKYTTPGTGAHFAENAVKKVYGKAQEIAKRSGLI